MSASSDNPADPFKKALAEATKVMANDPELAVSFSVDPAGQTAESIRLPQVSRRMTREEVLLARGTADAFALRHKFHNTMVTRAAGASFDLICGVGVVGANSGW